MLPISYNIRSLLVRKTTTIATASGIALVVFVFSSVLMLQNGIKRTLGLSGRADNAIVLSKGADAELSSTITTSQLSLLEAKPQLAQAAGGGVLAVEELVVVMTMDKLGTTGVANVQLRGVPIDALAFRPEVRLIAGRAPNPARNEVLVGKAIRGRFRGLMLGQKFALRSNLEMTVVGIFESGGSSFESEVWASLDDLRSAFGRTGLASSVRVRLSSPDALVAFQKSVAEDPQLGFDVLRETEYYEKQSEGLAMFITVLGMVIAVFFSIGAMIGAMITMYGSVASRQREIGTLRALGFSRIGILTSFLAESIFLCAAGGLIGALGSLAMGAIRFSVMNFASWSEIVFTFTPTPGIILGSLAFAAFMGLLGGFFPAVRAARIAPAKAMRG